MGEVLAPITQSSEFRLIMQLCSLFYIVFWFAMVFWTWRDADRRGAMPWFWALTVLIFSVAGWVIYMVARPPEWKDDVRERELEIRAKEIALANELATCPACHKPVEGDFLICPYCMKKLRRPCTECQRPLRLNWGVCPYCKTKQ